MAFSNLHRAQIPSRRLVLLVHGYSGGPGQLDAVRDHVVRTVFADADIYIPKLPISRLFTTVPVSRIIRDLSTDLDTLWEERRALGDGGYEELMILGFSFGSLLARGVYLDGLGALDTVHAEAIRGRGVRPWAQATSRIILLAGMNRGWTTQSPVSWEWALIVGLGSLISNLWPFRPFAYEQVRRGTPFLTELRLAWINATAQRDGAVSRLLVIQLLGTIDDVVSPADNIDLYSGDEFFYIEVPASGHNNILSVAPERQLAEEPAGENDVRRSILQAAFTAPKAELIAAQQGDNTVRAALKGRVLAKELLGDPDEYKPDSTAEHVVFIMHGIRDQGYWTEKIARKIRQSAPDQDRIRVIHPSYGYFPILPFVLPFVRRSKTEWLMTDMSRSARNFPTPTFPMSGIPTAPICWPAPSAIIRPHASSVWSLPTASCVGVLTGSGLQRFPSRMARVGRPQSVRFPAPSLPAFSTS